MTDIELDIKDELDFEVSENNAHETYNFDSLKNGDAVCSSCNKGLFPESHKSFVRRMLPLYIKYLTHKDKLSNGNLGPKFIPKVNGDEIAEIVDDDDFDYTDYKNRKYINLDNRKEWVDLKQTIKTAINEKNNTRKEKPLIVLKDKKIEHIGMTGETYLHYSLNLPPKWFKYEGKNSFVLSKLHKQYKENIGDDKIYYTDTELLRGKNCTVRACDKGICDKITKKSLGRSAKNIIKNENDYKKEFCNIRSSLFLITTDNLLIDGMNAIGSKNVGKAYCEKCGEKYIWDRMY